ncbi:MAG: diphthine synthase [Candidatus Bathyarchaeia archaeon]
MLTFVGLGLYDETGLSLKGLEEVKGADLLFAEFYTSLMPGLSVPRLVALAGKRVRILSRRDLEEDSESILLGPAKTLKVCLLVPGDPMTATTHVDLRLRAEAMDIATRVVHAASIETAAPAAAGLQSYKFGRSVTIPFADGGGLPGSVYDYCRDNKALGLHTLILLDLRVEEGRYMSISEALEILSRLEEWRREDVFPRDRLMVGMARLGGPDAVVKADRLEELMDFMFGGPPYTLIAPGRLHFMEVEALKVLAGAPEEVFKD